ncbi:unnamed protein product [Pleuronectes platessa]|uniref:Uncharacterized protein n=1 Tax=Pleuronectes platessa TaxID=8262 RepID=A0A9N7U082_PLEPL|nr:unnamed protein product [Pleuronectes platessa]
MGTSTMKLEEKKQRYRPDCRCAAAAIVFVQFLISDLWRTCQRLNDPHSLTALRTVRSCPCACGVRLWREAEESPVVQVPVCPHVTAAPAVLLLQLCCCSSCAAAPAARTLQGVTGTRSLSVSSVRAAFRMT